MAPPEQYDFGPFHLDAAERELRRDGELVALTSKACDLLLILLRGAGRTFSKSELMAALWPDTAVEESNLTQTVFMLRRALGDTGQNGSGYILTVPRRGYKFAGTVRVREVPPLPGVAAAEKPVKRSPSTIAAALVFAAAVVAGIVTWVWSRSEAGNATSAEFRPFAFTSEPEGGGAWSPDGSMIAFLSAGRLMVQPAGGGASTQLVDRASAPLAWSPDAARIYFAAPDGIYAVNRAGGLAEPVMGKEQLAGSGAVPTPGQPSFLTFDLSPDGNTLAVWWTPQPEDGRVRGSVWISSPPGAELREYLPAPFATPGRQQPVYLRFSPDGKQLFLARTSRGGGPETWVLPLPPGAGPPRRLFAKVQWNRPPMPSWMPDSRRLVLAANAVPLSPLSLWLADTRDESLIKLPDGGGDITSPSVSPDGTRLLFSRTDINSDIVELPLDGSPMRKLLATDLSEYSPSWLPADGQFAYLTYRNGPVELWVRVTQGEWERPVVTARQFPNLLALTNPAVSPDGARVAYAAVTTEGTGLYISPTAGGTPVRVSSGYAPAWSPNSDSIVFGWIKPDGSATAATLRLGSNQEPFEIGSPRGCYLPQWSPSGEWIACGSETLGPVLISPDGKVKRTLATLGATVFAWSKDSRTIYGLSTRNGQAKLLAQDVKTERVREVADYGTRLRPFGAALAILTMRLSLAPNGESLAIGTATSKQDLWILENFSQHSGR